MNSPARPAQMSDLDALVALENSSFMGDKISRRSFKHFLDTEQNQILVIDQPVQAYVLILFRRGTSLARIYSLAVAPEARGRGLARALMEAAEACARLRGALFLRLEVADSNEPAIGLYRSLEFRPIKQLAAYYENGADALQLEKRLERNIRSNSGSNFYPQTTDFTCGPAAAIMAMQAIRPNSEYGRIDEINLWREATTVYMTRGHGGCSPHGLALALHQRSFDVRLLQSNNQVAFIDSVRGEHKKELVELVHNDHVARLQQAKVPSDICTINSSVLRQQIDAGYTILLLISTWQLNRNKAPHWVWLSAIDERFAYLHDPDVDPLEHRSALDNANLPLALDQLNRILGYGKNGYRAAVLIRERQ
ncbi:GNAT family N-acetyltransferase/peptidase C39 family protein [Gilvimarinus polysaccharolyticus]|uniref:GNAT family N-acetyltransferase/peptidase C39 family protein n=1 Tax=Gilvimarinus polysaccharolyticus TaxID=863921 RepID=UPI0006733314|nr:GNAT family N-acetyltransferase/peptidase C39 family protein [Gilvimarinus polysaccharolyticus]